VNNDNEKAEKVVVLTEIVNGTNVSYERLKKCLLVCIGLHGPAKEMMTSEI
jgi:hypothetical protein